MTVEWYKKRAKRIKKDPKLIVLLGLKLDPAPSLMTVQHALVKMAGFASWKELLDASDAARQAGADRLTATGIR